MGCQIFLIKRYLKVTAIIYLSCYKIFLTLMILNGVTGKEKIPIEQKNAVDNQEN